MLAPCVGLVLFDVLRKTYAIDTPRYALAASRGDPAPRPLRSAG
jgi:hypothetical protein